jgi:hypothetical protein
MAPPISPWAAAPWTDDQQMLNPAMAQEPAAPQVPQVFAPVAKAAPSPLEGNIANDQQQLEKVRWNQANPWGTPENHPGALGKAAHVFSKVGNIAGDIFAPHVMANIPGTEANMQVRESELANRLNKETTDESENENRAATTAHTAEETAEMPGNAKSKQALEKAETDAAENKPDAFDFQQTDHGLMRINKSTGEAVPVTFNGQPLQPKVAPTKAGTKTVQLEINGKPHQVLIDEATGKTIQDLGESGEKPPVVNVNAGVAGLDRETARFAKPYEKGVADANAQLEKINEATSMINGSAESQALGIPKILTALISGQGSGVRITQSEQDNIARARGLEGDLQGTLNKWEGKGKLTSTQQKQLTGVLNDVKALVTEKAKIHSQALDSINGAGSREEAIRADKDARQKISDLEQHGHYAGQTVQLKNGKSVVVQKVHPDGSFD